MRLMWPWCHLVQWFVYWHLFWCMWKRALKGSYRHTHSEEDKDGKNSLLDGREEKVREMEPKRYTPGADYIIHHSQTIVANMSFILLKLLLPSRGPLCALTNASHLNTHKHIVFSLCTVCVQLVESITGLLGRFYVRREAGVEEYCSVLMELCFC